MELENRLASGRCFPATFGRACRYDYQEGRSRTRRRLSRQLDLRTTERQRQEVEDLEDYVVVRPRRCRAQARSRRTRAAGVRFRDFGALTRIFGRRNVLTSGLGEALRCCRRASSFSVRPELRSKKESSPAPLRFPV